MNKLILILAVSMLTACGGGSSDSGNGQPGDTAFSGTWSGTITYNIPELARVSYPMRIEIATNGAAMTYVDGPDDSDVVCIDNTDPAFINGANLSLRSQGTCFVAALGRCDVTSSGNIRFAGDSAVGSGSINYNCSIAGRISVDMAIGLEKR